MIITGLDVLVNNAARIYFPDSTETYEKQARDTIETNYYGNKLVYKSEHYLTKKLFCHGYMYKYFDVNSFLQ